LGGRERIEVEGKEEDGVEEKERTGQAKGEDPKSVVMAS